MDRVPLIEPDTPLDPTAAEVRDLVMRSRGQLLRPFAVLLHRPELARHAAELGAQLRFAGELRDDQRELAILATARAHGNTFEWLEHRDLAVSSGVRPAAVAALERDAGGDAFTTEEAALVDLARAFVRTSQVDDATFARAQALLGTAGVVELTMVVGYYSMLACVLNTCAPGAD